MIQAESEMFAGPDRQRLVVIGNGMASLRLLERLGEHAPGRFDVTVVEEHPRG